MNVKLTGRVIAILPEQSGTSEAGKQWKSQDFVVETTGQYPKKIAINAFGDKKISELPAINSDVEAEIIVESREHQGKWYTKCSLWNITTLSAPQPVQTPQAAPQAEGDSLPF